MNLENISPIDGRYQKDTEELSKFFSESSLIRYRVMIEIEYLLALGKEKNFVQIKNFSKEEKKNLRNIYQSFNLEDAEQIKTIEEVTKHDVKAIEYFLQTKFVELGFEEYIPFIHFALTSEDINNMAYILSFKHALQKIYLPQIKKVIEILSFQSNKYKSLAILSMTHGQPATPTTLGKEFVVYVERLERQIKKIESHTFAGKLNGAVGNFAAHHFACSSVDWKNFSTEFISFFGLEPLLLSTQVNSYDSLVESFMIVSHINIILSDLSKDMWLYISRGIFSQVVQENEVGSSTMPHKVNPINFENAEGNVSISNAIFNSLIDKLPQSRMQRDLSGSTVIRNQGGALAHALLVSKNIVKGLNKVVPNIEKIKKELDENFEVVTEALQTILRKNGNSDAYEKIKSLSRGKRLTREVFLEFVETLDLPVEDRVKLQMLVPEFYTGIHF
ncbi:MAG: adenylosuccinate lyase [Candidatus Magasanikbacteria bacterium CG_4_10_14_0_2_um_filter_33_14]|uniref:Adenylosuccinate lyase n=1 Tax=Candidatus Magasanikbacteria bacterium CG_4_10_14_0_2_um_filter_33_14 TaxID=1974636 RepID=A0A2M7VAJ9_9BACT|nr:MAG: adenylosuccinate lyase [Candidatus Magasanikbacteria bacterium CG_4_10_14_0_2_um_filter_33_14]